MCRIGAFLRYTYIVVLQYCTWGKHSLFITTTRSWSSSHSLCYLSLPHRGWSLSLYCSAWHMWHRLTLDRWVHFDVNSNCTNRESSHWPCPACVVDHRVLRLSGSPLCLPETSIPALRDLPVLYGFVHHVAHQSLGSTLRFLWWSGLLAEQNWRLRTLNITCSYSEHMLPKLLDSTFCLLLCLLTTVHALGTSCSAPLGQGTAVPDDPFWLETIKHQGTAAFNPNPATYQVFRNVKVSALEKLWPDLTISAWPGFWCQGWWCYRWHSSDQVSEQFCFTLLTLQLDQRGHISRKSVWAGNMWLFDVSSVLFNMWGRAQHL